MLLEEVLVVMVVAFWDAVVLGEAGARLKGDHNLSMVWTLEVMVITIIRYSRE